MTETDALAALVARMRQALRDSDESETGGGGYWITRHTYRQIEQWADDLEAAALATPPSQNALAAVIADLRAEADRVAPVVDSMPLHRLADRVAALATPHSNVESSNPLTVEADRARLAPPQCVCRVDDGLVQEWVSKARAVAKSKGYDVGAAPVPPAPPTNSDAANSPTPLELRRMDTPANRAFWASVEAAKAEWEHHKPSWARELEQRQEAVPLAQPFKIHDATMDPSPCFHDQASGPSCANDAHYRPPTYEDWMGHSPAVNGPHHCAKCGQELAAPGAVPLAPPRQEEE